jgi:hypothetical protein
MLSSFGFKVQYISMDGAQSNRDLFTLNEVDLQLGADVWGPKRGKLCTFEPQL